MSARGGIEGTGCVSVESSVVYGVDAIASVWIVSVSVVIVVVSLRLWDG